MKALFLAPAVILPLLSDASAVYNQEPKRAGYDHGVSWTPCYDDPHIECSSFRTPLDYQNPSVGDAKLAMIRYKATRQPRIGTLWMNPGGPGGSGVDAIGSGDGELLSNITGGFFDIASWDPRGVNNSLPSVNCFSSGIEEATFWNGTIPWVGLEATGNFSDPNELQDFYAQVPLVDSQLEQLGQRCASLSDNKLQYMGSAAAVRDMVAMTDCLDGPQAPINYWGFSYGTIIGAYFVNMFPERVGRVVIDGVVNPELWANAPAIKGWGDAISDTDKVLHAFANACANAGPGSCEIAQAGENGTAVYQWIIQLLDAAYASHQAGGKVSSSDIRGKMHSAMYGPRSWDALATWLADQARQISGKGTQSNKLPPSSYRSLMTGITAPAATSEEIERSLMDKLQPPKNAKAGHINHLAQRYNRRRKAQKRSDNSDPASDYSFQAITCSDAPDASYNTTVVFDELVRVTREVSQVFGPQWGDATLYCHRWPARATERFRGPWNNTTLNNPILVIGNEADPITPLHDAKFVADQLGNSAKLVEQEGYGHTSLAEHSDCTIQVLATYFISGKLPKVTGKTCTVNQPLFSSLEDAAADVSIISNITAIPEAGIRNQSTDANHMGNSAVALSFSSAHAIIACIASVLVGVVFLS